MGFLSKLLKPKNLLKAAGVTALLGGGAGITSAIGGAIGSGKEAMPQLNEAEKAAADAKAAAEAQATELERQKKDQEQVLKNIQANAQKLSAANAQSSAGFVANVVSGGTAGLYDTANPRKRRGSGTSVASSLGLDL